MEAVVDIKYRPALHRHGGRVEVEKLGSPAAAWGGAIEPAVVYLECLRNHAASAGGHVVDGCGEFMPASAGSLKCAACGCHRSFHRRVVTEGPPALPPPRLALLPPPLAVVAAAPPHLLRGEGTPEDRVPGAADGWDGETDDESDYDDGGPMSPLPAPPTGYLALNTGAPASGSAPAVASRPPFPVPVPTPQGTVPGGSLAAARKRFRTKFSPEQKQRMRELSERLGWRLQRRDEAAVADCCSEIGVTRGVFKVWMHNNKHNFVAGHSARRTASASTVDPVAAAVQVQPSSHTAAPSAPPPAPAANTDFNINGSAEYCVVQQATASGGAPQPS